MCGIAGIFHLNKTSEVGREMTTMLQSMKHRGPDSTGFAVYAPVHEDELAIRMKYAENEDLAKGFEIHDQIKQRKSEVHRRIESLGGKIISSQEDTEYAYNYRVRYQGDLRGLADYVEDVEGVEILSIGNALELVKDLGDANQVSANYNLNEFAGTHAIGHVRMATESDVDICSAHPYWAYPFRDVSVVHNGQLTNYWGKRRELERRGHRFVSNCDSELIAVYVADKMVQGYALEDAMQDSISDLDGVFTYLIATGDSLGMAKDVMSAKPMVLYEGNDCIVLASEEVAIRSVFPHEIDTSDPYAGEVMVWSSDHAKSN